MRKTVDKSAYTSVYALRIFVCVLICCLFFSFLFLPSVADAVCPENYVESVKNENLDWQNDENNLDLDFVKKTVSEWLADPNFDFSAIEKDPIVVAIIDTGVNFDHEIFTGNYDENGKKINASGVGEYDVFYRDSQGNVVSKNTADDDKSATDDSSNRHGTHVAGIVATLIHELNLEKYIKIMPIKASRVELGNTKFDDTHVRNAINFALSNGADVVNMSIADNGVSPGKTSSFDMVSKTDAGKAVFVAAAGNGKIFGTSSKNKWYYPGASKNVIGVMNYTVENGKKKLAATSNYGSAYDICAPGSAIFSADGKTADAYKSLGGTSMASPIVAFASALAMLKDRAYCAVSKEQNKSCTEIAEYVKSSYSESISKSGFKNAVFDFKQLLTDEIRARIVADENGGGLSQYINNVYPVKLRFEIFPHSYEGKGNVVWKIDGKSIDNPSGDSFLLEYTPKNEIGSVEVHAEWTYGAEIKTSQCTVSVEYVEYDREETEQIQIDVSKNGGNIDLNEADGSIDTIEGDLIKFSVDEKVLQNTKPGTSVLWYVDDKCVGTGNEFSCKFEEEGVHYVKAKIGDYFTSEIIVKTKAEILEKSRVLDIVTIVLSCALAICFVGVVSTILIKKSKTK